MCPGCHESSHYPFRLVIFGKYHFEKPIMLFPIVLLASLLRRRISPSRFRSRLTRAIFCERRFNCSSLSPYGVSRQHKPTKVIPKTAQVTQLPVGKKCRSGTHCGKRVARGSRGPGNGFTLISVEGLGGREKKNEPGRGREENR